MISAEKFQAFKKFFKKPAVASVAGLTFELLSFLVRWVSLSVGLLVAWFNSGSRGHRRGNWANYIFWPL